MKVLLVVASLLPSYGGPAFSVSRLAMALADGGITVGLWASDKSASVTPLLHAHPGVRPMAGALGEAVGNFGETDIVHDNGIWLPHNHRLAALAAKRKLIRVVSIRGMLDPWAINHKKLKKKAAWLLYQRRDLCRASYHHATAIAEAEHLRNFRLGVPVGVISNGIDVANVNNRRERLNSEIRTALFMGRIHPVKGLSLLLEAWARLRPPHWRLQIAGPDEAGHRAELEQEISAKSLSDDVHFLGPLSGEAKERAFRDADLFVLPSFSESFGMAVGEALAHGIPVLTTTGTPWPMLPAHGCGWQVSATVEGITGGLSEATDLDTSTLVTMGQRGRELVKNDFSWPNIARQFIDVYETLLRQREN